MTPIGLPLPSEPIQNLIDAVPQPRGAGVKERPILMSGPTVRALLTDKKRQTRRVITPQPVLTERAGFRWRGGDWGQRPESDGGGPYLGEFLKKCPYGMPGDRLWVRETFCTTPGYVTFYRADTPVERQGELRWRPSIYMPRMASRILLEVTRVRVERVQAITEQDAGAEGTCIRHDFDALHWVMPGTERAARGCFARTWNELNEHCGYGWAENPWVWVVDFKVVRP